MAAIIERPTDPGSRVEGNRKSKPSIKMVSCLIRREKLDLVTAALNKLNLVGGMTVTDVGVWPGERDPELYRGPRYVMPFVPKVLVELAIESGDVIEVEKLVTELARTGDVGDGKIFILDVINAMRIRTGEGGVSAL